MRWPVKRVEGLYKAIVVREAVESIEQQRRDMIAACYSNPNWDGKDNADKRKQYLDDLNRHFNEAITAVYHPHGPREQDVDWNNPFFAAHKREIARTQEALRLMQEGTDPADEVPEVAEAKAEPEPQASSNGKGRYSDIDQISDEDEIPRNR